MPPNPEAWDTCTSVRLNDAMRSKVLDLRAELGGVEEAKISTVLRELLRISLLVVDPPTSKRVTSLSMKLGVTRDEVWHQALDIGLDALADQPVDEGRGGDGDDLENDDEGER